MTVENVRVYRATVSARHLVFVFCEPASLYLYIMPPPPPIEIFIFASICSHIHPLICFIFLCCFLVSIIFAGLLVYIILTVTLTTCTQLSPPPPPPTNLTRPSTCPAEVPAMALPVQPLNASVAPGGSITLSCPAGTDSGSGSGGGDGDGGLEVFWVFSELAPPRLATVQQLQQARRTALVSELVSGAGGGGGGRG